MPRLQIHYRKKRKRFPFAPRQGPTSGRSAALVEKAHTTRCSTVESVPINSLQTAPQAGMPMPRLQIHYRKKRDASAVGPDLRAGRSGV